MRRRVAFLACCFMALFLTACAGKGLEDRIHSVPSQTPILVVGDSLSAAYGLSSPEQGWVSILERNLKAEGLLRPDQSVRNESVSGATVAEGEPRLDSALAQSSPGLVIIGLGSTDAMRRMPLKDSEDALVRMAEKSKAAGAQVILFGADLPPQFFFMSTAHVRSMYASAASRSGAALLPNILSGVNSRSDLMLPDGLHPSSAGQEPMADAVRTAIGRLR